MTQTIAEMDQAEQVDQARTPDTAHGTADDSASREGPSVEKSADGVDVDLDELDALLAEVSSEVAQGPVEQGPSERVPVEEDPAETAPPAPAGAAVLPEEPVSAEVESPPVHEPALPSSQDSGNPWSKEVSELEQDWGEDGKPEVAPSSETSLVGQDPATSEFESPAGNATVAGSGRFALIGVLAARLGRTLCAAGGWILAVLDTPFQNLSPATKALIGHAALATLAMAAGVWVWGTWFFHR